MRSLRSVSDNGSYRGIKIFYLLSPVPPILSEENLKGTIRVRTESPLKSLEMIGSELIPREINDIYWKLRSVSNPGSFGQRQGINN